MKRFLSILLAGIMLVGMLFVFSSCAKETEKLTLGVTIFEPMNYRDANGD
jgi:hypothetical protein